MLKLVTVWTWSFNKEYKKKELNHYYYQILNILGIPMYSSTQTQNKDGDQGGDSKESDDEPGMRDESHQASKSILPSL